MCNSSDPFGLCPKDAGGDGASAILSDCPIGSKGYGEFHHEHHEPALEHTAFDPVMFVLAVLTGGSSAAVEAEAATTEKVVIGETMDRVRAAALDASAGVFEKAPGATAQEIYKANMSWLRGAMHEGKEVIDIGTDLGRGERSPWYRLEKELLERRGYPVTKISHP
ncbi:MAG: hypothetical protein ACREN6_02640 [Gemmatimonadaceae bacterium]